MSLQGVRVLFVILSLLASGFSFAVKHIDTKMGAESTFWERWKAAISEYVPENVKGPDPFEPLNRKIFAFNDTADRYILKPIAKGYQTITPDVVETGVGNVFANLRDVITVVNDLLQFKFTDAASDTGRVLVNSTIGIAGIFDVASTMGLTKHQEDFGQTLGKWGVGAGPYIVVPLFGPYTLRSGIGALVDSPIDYVVQIDHIPTRNSTWSGRAIDDRAALLSAEQLISGDRYTFIRDAYTQRRQAAAIDGVVEDKFGEEDYEDDWLE